MPTIRETILAALNARFSALPATVLRGEALPEPVPAGDLLVLRGGKPGEWRWIISSAACRPAWPSARGGSPRRQVPQNVARTTSSGAGGRLRSACSG